MQYYIDQKIISLFLDSPPESQEVKDYMQKYAEKLNKLVDEGIKKYLKKKKNMSDQEIKREFDLVDSFDDADKSALFDDDVMIEAERIRHNFHKDIYEYYQAILDNQQKIKLNVYIQQKQKEIDQDFDAQKQMMLDVLGKVKQEYEQTGNIEEREKNQLTEQDLLAMQQDLDKRLEEEMI